MARKLSFTGLIIAAIAVLLISVSFSMPVISYGEDELQNAAETTAETTMQFSEEKTAEVSEEPAKENTAPAETASAPEKSAPSEDLAAAEGEAQAAEPAVTDEPEEPAAADETAPAADSSIPEASPADETNSEDPLVPAEPEVSSAEGLMEHTRGGLEWGYANPDKGVIWVLDNGTMTLYLNNDPDLPALDGLPSDLPAPGGDKEKAATQLFDSNGTSYRKVSGNTFQLTEAGKTLSGKVTSLVVKEGITGLGWKAMWDNNSYEPEYDDTYTVDRMNTGVFQDFSQLTSVTTCSTIKRIGWSAFRKCSALTSFDFTSMTNLEEIMNQAFNPTALTSIGLSACTGLKTIRQSAFYESTKISEVILPAGLEQLGAQAFAKCNNISTVKFMDAGKLTLLGHNAFMNNKPSLKFITDEATKRKAYIRKAAVKLFTGAANPPIDAFSYTGLLDQDLWPLSVNVHDKDDAVYNGSEQKGYSTTGSGCDVSGLQMDHVMGENGYTPAAGTDAGTYYGQFSSPLYDLVVDSTGYFCGINYDISAAAGKLVISKNGDSFEISLNGSTYTSDGNPHAIAPDEGKPSSTAKGTTSFSYSFEESGTYVSDLSSLTKTEPGKYTVYVKGTNPNYTQTEATTTAVLHIRPTVTFVDENGNVIDGPTAYDYGTEAKDIEKPAAPAKPEDAQYTYTFKGWSPDIADATKDAVYKATYTATPKPQPAPAAPENTDTGKKAKAKAAKANTGGNNGGADAGNGGGTASPADDGQADGEVIPDEPTPAAEPEDEEIPEQETPLAPEDDEESWPLLNLILAVLTLIGAVIAFFHRKKDDSADSKKVLIAKILGLIVGILAPIVFFITEDIVPRMVMTDRYTPLMFLLLAIQIAFAVIVWRASKESGEDE